MDMNLLPALGDNRPDLFALQWDAVFEVAAAIVLLSIIVERFLAPVFESDFYINKQRVWDAQGKGNFKVPIAFALSVVTCLATGIDILAVIGQAPSPSYFGTIISAGVVAGGSKGSIKLFRDILGFKSSAYRQYQEDKAVETQAKVANRSLQTPAATNS